MNDKGMAQRPDVDGIAERWVCPDQYADGPPAYEIAIEELVAWVRHLERRVEDLQDAVYESWGEDN